MMLGWRHEYLLYNKERLNVNPLYGLKIKQMVPDLLDKCL
jgi:hypothetical protein